MKIIIIGCGRVGKTAYGKIDTDGKNILCNIVRL